MSALREALRRAEAQARRETGREDEQGRSAAESSLYPQPATEACESHREPVTARAAPALTLEPLHEVAANAAETVAAGGTARANAPVASEQVGRTAQRRPLLFAIGLLAAAAAAFAAYYWQQFRAVAATPPGRPVPIAAEKIDQVPRTPVPDDAFAAWPAEETVSSGVRAEIEGRSQPSEPRSPKTAVSPQATPITVSHEVSATVSPVPRQAARVHPQIETGYAALQSGDLAAARVAYRRALDEEPLNRDALLGMAAVERYARRDAQAASYLESLRSAHPGDAHAVAGLIALAAESLDPARTASRLKALLASNPDAPSLHLLLGNQYARQSRWAEAQQAYMQAHEGDPGNPDVAFNLAVSYDRLEQPARAREFYSRALGLAGGRAATFAPETALRRLQEIGD